MGKLRITASLVAAALSLGVGVAHAFPDKPVTLIVPFPPGGTSDQAARPFAAALERLWKKPVVVTNKPGAGSAIGLQAAASADPDGHTLVTANPAYTLMPAADKVLKRDPSFDPEQLVPLARFTADPFVVIVRNDAAWTTLDEFIEEARKRPGELSYGSSGPYASAHVFFEMVAQQADIELNHVPYQGGGPLVAALLGGEVSAAPSGPAHVKPLIDDGEARALFHSGADKIELLPDVPSASKLGVEFYLWNAVLTSAKVPGDVVATLRNDIAKAVQDPQYVDEMKKLGIPVAYMSGSEFEQSLRAESHRFEEVISRIGSVD